MRRPLSETGIGQMLELAWAAGFFDGEGSIQLRRGTMLQLYVGQTDPRPLERFAAAVGAGKVRGPYGPYARNGKPNNWKPMYAWQLGGRKAESVFATLRPYLSEPKREQYDVIKGE